MDSTTDAVMASHEGPVSIKTEESFSDEVPSKNGGPVQPSEAIVKTESSSGI